MKKAARRGSFYLCYPRSDLLSCRICWLIIKVDVRLCLNGCLFSSAFKYFIRWGIVSFDKICGKRQNHDRYYKTPGKFLKKITGFLYTNDIAGRRTTKLAG